MYLKKDNKKDVKPIQDSSFHDKHANHDYSLTMKEGENFTRKNTMTIVSAFNKISPGLTGVVSKTRTFFQKLKKRINQKSNSDSPIFQRESLKKKPIRENCSTPTTNKGTYFSNYFLSTNGYALPKNVLYAQFALGCAVILQVLFSFLNNFKILGSNGKKAFGEFLNVTFLLLCTLSLIITILSSTLLIKKTIKGANKCTDLKEGDTSSSGTISNFSKVSLVSCVRSLSKSDKLAITAEIINIAAIALDTISAFIGSSFFIHGSEKFLPGTSFLKISTLLDIISIIMMTLAIVVSNLNSPKNSKKDDSETPDHLNCDTATTDTHQNKKKIKKENKEKDISWMDKKLFYIPYPAGVSLILAIISLLLEEISEVASNSKTCKLAINSISLITIIIANAMWVIPLGLSFRAKAEENQLEITNTLYIAGATREVCYVSSLSYR